MYWATCGIGRSVKYIQPSLSLSSSSVSHYLDFCTKKILVEEVLTKIAEVTGGLYKEGNNTNDVIEFVVKLLKDMDKKEFEAKKFVSYKDRFQSFLIGALFFLIIDLLLFEKKTKWLQKLNLFIMTSPSLLPDKEIIIYI